MSILTTADTWLKNVQTELHKFKRALYPFPNSKRDFIIRYSGIDAAVIKTVKISDKRLFEIAFKNRYQNVKNISNWFKGKFSVLLLTGGYKLHKKYDPITDLTNSYRVLNHLRDTNDTLSDEESIALTMGISAILSDKTDDMIIKGLKDELEELKNSVPPTEEEIEEKRAKIKATHDAWAQRQIEKHHTIYYQYGGVLEDDGEYHGEFESLMPIYSVTLKYGAAFPVMNLQMWGYTRPFNLCAMKPRPTDAVHKLWADLVDVGGRKVVKVIKHESPPEHIPETNYEIKGGKLALDKLTDAANDEDYEK